MQVMDYYTRLCLAKQSFLYIVIFPTILAAFGLLFLYEISVNSFDFTLIIPFIILPVVLWLIWRAIPICKPELLTYELPFKAGAGLHGQTVQIECTNELLHYTRCAFPFKVYEREVHCQDIEYVTLQAPGSGVLNLNLQCKNSTSVEIKLNEFSPDDAVIILDIILRNAPHVTCNEFVTTFRQGKYWPTDTTFLA